MLSVLATPYVPFLAVDNYSSSNQLSIVKRVEHDLLMLFYYQRLFISGLDGRQYVEETDMYDKFESNFDRISIRLMSTKNIFENKSGLVKNLENHEVLKCL